jgi:hypothetical protein
LHAIRRNAADSVAAVVAMIAVAAVSLVGVVEVHPVTTGTLSFSVAEAEAGSPLVRPYPANVVLGVLASGAA